MFKAEPFELALYQLFIGLLFEVVEQVCRPDVAEAGTRSICWLAVETCHLGGDRAGTCREKQQGTGSDPDAQPMNPCFGLKN